jgi:hypothetical protein
MSEKRVILFSMLQTIKRFFSIEKSEIKSKGKKKKSAWAEKQIREMAKLGGKLVLM